MLYGMMRALERMEKHTDQAISRLDGLEKKAKEVRRSSVIKKLKTIQDRKQKESGERVHRKAKETVR